MALNSTSGPILSIPTYKQEELWEAFSILKLESFTTKTTLSSYTHDVVQAQMHGDIFKLPPILTSSCLRCGGKSSLRRADIHNANGNGGRQYYACPKCPFGWGFVTWADGRGVSSSNPLCGCGYPSRENRKGITKKDCGSPFWVCAIGACGYYTEDQKVPSV